MKPIAKPTAAAQRGRAAQTGRRHRDYVAALARGLAVIQAFTDSEPEMTLSEADDLRAALAKALEQGYAAQDSQLEIGVLSIAVPVRDPQQRVIAAINCSTEAERTSMDELLSTRLPALREAAASIEAAIQRAPALAHSISAAS